MSLIADRSQRWTMRHFSPWLYMQVPNTGAKKPSTDKNADAIPHFRHAELIYDGQHEAIHGQFTSHPRVSDSRRVLLHYQFASDKDYQQEDIDKRNRDQVVTRWIHRGEEANDLESWVVLRVDQLWMWIIAPGELDLRLYPLIVSLTLTFPPPSDVIITSSTHRLDGRPDVVSSSVFNHLQKGHSQPKTVHELADLITKICIRFYDQTQETVPEKPEVKGARQQGRPDEEIRRGRRLDNSGDILQFDQQSGS